MKTWTNLDKNLDKPRQNLSKAKINLDIADCNLGSCLPYEQNI